MMNMTLKNKVIIKSLSAGMAAMLAITPMSVYAQEENTDDMDNLDMNNSGAESENENLNSVEEAKAELEEAESNYEAAAEAVEELQNELADFNESVEKLNLVENNSETNQEVSENLESDENQKDDVDNSSNPEENNSRNEEQSEQSDIQKEAEAILAEVETVEEAKEKLDQVEEALEVCEAEVETSLNALADLAATEGDVITLVKEGDKVVDVVVDWNKATENVNELYAKYQDALANQSSAEEALEIAQNEHKLAVDQANEAKADFTVTVFDKDNKKIDNKDWEKLQDSDKAQLKEDAVRVNTSLANNEQLVNTMIHAYATIMSTQVLYTDNSEENAVTSGMKNKNNACYEAIKELLSSSNVDADAYEWKGFINNRVIENGVRTSYGSFTFYDKEANVLMRRNFSFVDSNVANKKIELKDVEQFDVQYNFYNKDAANKYGVTGSILAIALDNDKNTITKYMASDKVKTYFNGKTVSKELKTYYIDSSKYDSAVELTEELAKEIEAKNEALKEAEDALKAAKKAYEDALARYDEIADKETKLRDAQLEEAKEEYLEASINLWLAEKEAEEKKEEVSDLVDQLVEELTDSSVKDALDSEFEARLDDIIANAQKTLEADKAEAEETLEADKVDVEATLEADKADAKETLEVNNEDAESTVEADKTDAEVTLEDSSADVQSTSEDSVVNVQGIEEFSQGALETLELNENNSADVLGARRVLDRFNNQIENTQEDSQMKDVQMGDSQKAVLGARRAAATADKNNMAGYMMAMGMSSALGMFYISRKKRVNE